MADIKLKGICRFCKNLSVNVYGEYCLKARFNDTEYGSFWISNDCKHDEYNRPLKDFFEPVTEKDPAHVFMQREILELRKIRLDLEGENRKLRSLIK